MVYTIKVPPEFYLHNDVPPDCFGNTTIQLSPSSDSAYGNTTQRNKTQEPLSDTVDTRPFVLGFSTLGSPFDQFDNTCLSPFDASILSASSTRSPPHCPRLLLDELPIE